MLESDEPGSDKIEVKSDNGLVTKEVTTGSETKADTKAEVKKSVAQDGPTPRPTQYQKNVETHSMVSFIFFALQDFFQKLF